MQIESQEDDQTKSQEEVQTKSQEPKAHIEATKSETIATYPKPLEQEIEDNSTKHSKGKEPMLAKYVRRHHTPDY